jgi:hypothetical protein
MPHWPFNPQPLAPCVCCSDSDPKHLFQVDFVLYVYQGPEKPPAIQTSHVQKPEPASALNVGKDMTIWVDRIKGSGGYHSTDEQ